jgi:ATP-dependent Lon protease
VETQAPRRNASPPPPVADEIVRGPRLSTGLQWTLDRALAHANRRNHQYATLEHLVLALIEDPDASALMGECNADLGVLERSLVKYLDNDLKRLVIDGGDVPKPTAAFQRVVQRAVLHARDLGRPLVTGANTLLAIFPEARSPAVRFLEEQGMSDESRAVLFARLTGAATLHEK